MDQDLGSTLHAYDQAGAAHGDHILSKEAAVLLARYIYWCEGHHSEAGVDALVPSLPALDSLQPCNTE